MTNEIDFAELRQGRWSIGKGGAGQQLISLGRGHIAFGKAMCAPTAMTEFEQ